MNGRMHGTTRDTRQRVEHPALVSGLSTSATDHADHVDLGDVSVGSDPEVVIGEDKQHQHEGGEVRLLVRSNDAEGRPCSQHVRCDVYGYASVSTARRRLGR